MNKIEDLAISKTIVENIPFSVQEKLADMPLVAQQDFAIEFRKNMKSVQLTYILHFLGLDYIYLGKWGLQILYWFSWFTFLFPGIIWSIILYFRIPVLVNDINRKVAETALKNVILRYGYNKKIKEELVQNDPIRTVRARTLKEVGYNPSQLTVDNLKVGFIVDYNLKTWNVICENQYDWENGFSEKSFTLAQGTQKLHLFLNNDHDNQIVLVSNPINIYAIDESLEDEILKEKRSKNILSYNETNYYRENTKEGLKFDLINKTDGNKLIAWEYFDKERTQVIRIEQYGSFFF